jgi:hypothetical protein
MSLTSKLYFRDSSSPSEMSIEESGIRHPNVYNCSHDCQKQSKHRACMLLTLSMRRVLVRFEQCLEFRASLLLTGRLKYLNWDDYQRYTESIATYREHCIHDPKYIRVVHEQYLTCDPSDKKKTVASVPLLSSQV